MRYLLVGLLLALCRQEEVSAASNIHSKKVSATKSPSAGERSAKSANGKSVQNNSAKTKSNISSPVKSYIVVDANTGRILKKKRSDTKCHPASLTKQMTLFILFSEIKRGHINFNTKFRVSERASQQMRAKLELVAGETISVKTIIEALVVKSANDAAVVAAEGVAGSVENFVRRMNDAAIALKMYDTHFENASGVPNVKQVTTARDMALLARALVRTFPEFAHVFALRAFKYKGSVHYTHNRLLHTFHGTDGLKTGYVDMSGYNVSASVKRYDSGRNALHLICVVMGRRSPEARDKKVIKLLEPIFMERSALFYRTTPPQRPGLCLAGNRALLCESGPAIWMRAPVCTPNGMQLLLDQYQKARSMSGYLNQLS
ncbi:MAG: serine hydrolase [Holosporales bacterium]|nr:serine hydrolase [Holosporales bacterium]